MLGMQKDIVLWKGVSEEGLAGAQGGLQAELMSTSA